MLKAPFIRKTLRGCARPASPLEYNTRGSQKKAPIFIELLRLGDRDGPMDMDPSSSLTLWLYRSCLLHRLWCEGVVCDAIMANGLSAQDFTALLHRVLRPPHCLQKVESDASCAQADAVRLVWTVQKEFIVRILNAMVVNRQWSWPLEEVWHCATTLVADCVRPDDLVTVALLVPLARRLDSGESGGIRLRESLQAFDAKNLHGGVLWLIARHATESLQPDPRLLEAAATTACAAPTDALFVEQQQAAAPENTLKYDKIEEKEEEKQLDLILRLMLTHAPSRQRSSFSPFWRVLLYEMSRHAHSVLADKTAKQHVQVGAILSIRRVICSFRRHGLVHPVLELHEVVTAPWRTELHGDTFLVDSSAITPGRCGPLVYREMLLLDAYTLMTLGHVGETAVDVDDEAARYTAVIQARCIAHLDALAQSDPVRGTDRDAIGLHRGARAGIEQRLHEGIRLSFKILLRCGAYEAIQQLIARCPALGGSWEGGKALIMLGRHMEAVSVFTQFLQNTRRQFASGLPHHIRSLMEKAVEGAARSCLEDPHEASERMLSLYKLTRTWSFPVPAAVVFAAIVRGCVDSDGAKVQHITPQKRLETLHTLLRRRVALAAYCRDGLLLETLQVYVTLLAECSEGGETSYQLHLLSLLQSAHPMLPVCRVALLHFLRVDYQMGIATVLRQILPSPSGVTIHVEPLQELPLSALEALSRHVALAEAENQGLISAVSSALEYRRFAEEQRQPWQCHFCQQWNKKHATTCRRCGSLQLAVVRCHRCGGFSPSTSCGCLICGAETQQPVGDGGVPHVNDECKVYSLRKWRCGRCNHTNEPQHLFYCSKCGSVQPTMEKALTQTAFDCVSCGRHNPLGLLRPWCPACGTLCAVATSGPPKTLWRCVECCTLNPWLLTHCHGCGGSKPSAHARVDSPWYTLTCSSCNVTNPAWSVVCHGCGAGLTFHDTATASAVSAIVNGADRAIEEPMYAVCPHCGSPYVDDADIVCLTCFAYRPHTTCIFWVCLKDNCLGINLQRKAVEGLLVCRFCEATHDVATVGGCQSNPLRYREPISADAAGCSGRWSYEGDAGEDVPPPATVSNVNTKSRSRVEGLPNALLLPVPFSPRVCSSCGVFLQLQNIAHICQVCYHCGYSPSLYAGPSASEHGVALRLTLKAMLQTARRTASGAISNKTALSLLRSMTTAIQCAEEAQLPWRGCDLTKGMRCGVRPRMPVLENDEIHTAVRDVAEIIQCICTVAFRLTTGTASSGATGEPTTASWIDKRPWVSIALDLVDLMNRTTDYDELQFDVLAQLCELVRPHQRAHIYRETRWAYLRHMKLPREWFVNDVVCSTCLFPKRHTDVVVLEHVCCCKKGDDGASIPSAGAA